ncbi:hypothetical protein EVAR_61702_1 [Eumeta japonica]|uniref:Uncharacterized protein n=1 Tax=Eumeta variegata TaxID=151549 RepID=A0A4C1ZMP4_EUMVA|nr:hypothetical protein EVAR_61702_1 [Eumeta japonica]
MELDSSLTANSVVVQNNPMPTQEAAPPSARAEAESVKTAPVCGSTTKSRPYRTTASKSCPNVETFRSLNKYLVDNRVQFHTYALEEERKIKAVIRGIPTDFPIEEIQTDLRSWLLCALSAQTLPPGRLSALAHFKRPSTTPLCSSLRPTNFPALAAKKSAPGANSRPALRAFFKSRGKPTPATESRQAAGETAQRPPAARLPRCVRGPSV